MSGAINAYASRNGRSDAYAPIPFVRSRPERMHPVAAVLTIAALSSAFWAVIVLAALAALG